MATARDSRLLARLFAQPTTRDARPLTRPLATLIAIAGAAVTLLVPAASSSASPSLTLNDVKARIAALNDQAERITEAYDGARERLAQIQTKEQVAAHQLATDQKSFSQLKSRIGATANYAYRSGGLGGLSQLADLSTPDTFLTSSAMLDEITRYQDSQLAAVAAAAHTVAASQSVVTAQEAAARQQLKAITADRNRIEGLLAAQRDLLSRLRAADRARYLAAQRADAASQRALRYSYNGPASGRAAAAVRFAYAQLGKPYVYGAAGPNSYDCSGLTMSAWAAAGVSLPRTAAAQQGATRYVDRGNLQPGDLVFFGSPAYHVAIYIGGGRIIAAPHTGDVVKIQDLSYMPNYSGAGRP